jgi:hypothetical protein
VPVSTIPVRRRLFCTSSQPAAHLFFINLAAN